jgi:predicted DNA-binding transcriptional regulator AlpA
MAPILIDAQQAADVLGISLRLFRDISKRPGFPAARELGPRCHRFVLAELEAYAVALPAVMQSGEPAQLAAAREAKAAGLPVSPFAGLGGQ